MNLGHLKFLQNLGRSNSILTNWTKKQNYIKRFEPMSTTPSELHQRKTQQDYLVTEFTSLTNVPKVQRPAAEKEKELVARRGSQFQSIWWFP